MRKNFIQSLALIILVGTISACSSKTIITKSNNKPLPPGQQKKITGSQSAKEYAPGQTKKATTPAAKTTPASKSTPPGEAKKKK